MNIIKEEKFLNYDIIEYDVVDTTMNVAKNFKAKTIIIAQKQTSGKGKGNRVWNSENNNNLYFSLIIEANNNKLDYSQVSFITSVAMRYAISEFDNKNNSIISKWPNDILINNKKAVGILLEFDNNKLIIKSIIGKNDVSLEEIIANINIPYSYLELGFTPLEKDMYLFDCSLFDGGEDYRLFILGDELKFVEEKKMFFPLLSHA